MFASPWDCTFLISQVCVEFVNGTMLGFFLQVGKDLTNNELLFFHLSPLTFSIQYFLSSLVGVLHHTFSDFHSN